MLVADARCSVTSPSFRLDIPKGYFPSVGEPDSGQVYVIVIETRGIASHRNHVTRDNRITLKSHVHAAEKRRAIRFRHPLLKTTFLSCNIHKNKHVWVDESVVGHHTLEFDFTLYVIMRGKAMMSMAEVCVQKSIHEQDCPKRYGAKRLAFRSLLVPRER